MPTMKAAVVRNFGSPLAIEDVPVPQPGPGEVLVKVKACGVCHTDLHAASGDWPVKPVPPFIPGHEAAGIVAALGSGVSGLKVGDAVGVAWLHDACLRCEYCETGWETLCEHQHKWRVRRICHRFGRICGAAADRSRFRADCADSVRGCYDLQGVEGNGSAARRMGRDFGRRWARPRGDPIWQGDGPEGCRDRYRRGQAEARASDRR
jgi:hypothetical protein